MARKWQIIYESLGRPASYLGGNDQILLLPSKPLDSLAHDGLRFPAFVSLSGIEEIDSRIIRYFQALICSVYPVSC